MVEIYYHESRFRGSRVIFFVRWFIMTSFWDTNLTCAHIFYLLIFHFWWDIWIFLFCLRYLTPATPNWNRIWSSMRKSSFEKNQLYWAFSIISHKIILVWIHMCEFSCLFSYQVTLWYLLSKQGVTFRVENCFIYYMKICHQGGKYNRKIIVKRAARIIGRYLRLDSQWPN